LLDNYFRAGCAKHPGSEDILLIVKTGATEIYEKLTAHFLTTLACGPNYIIYSDLEQHIGPVHIRDAVRHISEHIQKENVDFLLYRKIHEYAELGQDIQSLKGMDGWNLDKWKFIPMLLDTFKLDSNKKWYVIIEADTYLSWTNLRLWLKQLPAEKLIYAGCQVVMGEGQQSN
jgi:hypothetical protein